ncbi:uncharacterized protein ACA1_072250 [Acanthamoeba castellanii str. Neff]|uniref:Tail-anchored protein insertion receptor WRB n=1 Tax=Acanthamoeba castellanii (strain ATCC 30010 / Neff) TaxID=1257118 RepID=L8HFW6_ACACF|nr:uncharacterized protein ACA1_072250 [Acanthamoeba castellanii str. Neff]ELR23603.1 hypothetical protein ACA1_072250 [Acanthamoeba castellanii str. Neff]
MEEHEHTDPSGMSWQGGDALLIFILVVLGQILATAPPKEEVGIEAKLAALQREARRLDAVSTFVRWSKVQRQIQALEKQRDRLRAERSRKRSVLLDNPIALFLLKHLLSQVVLPMLLVAWWWNTPILVADASTFGPWFVASWLAIPGWPVGTVGVVAWVAICRGVARLLP